jgi:hypothetical protein
MAVDTSVQLQLHLEPAEPIGIYELTASLTALARQYQTFVDRFLRVDRPSQAKLLVSSIAPGSIDISFIPDLSEAVAATAPFLGQLRAVTDFASHVKKLIDTFSNKEGAKKDVRK